MIASASARPSHAACFRHQEQPLHLADLRVERPQRDTAERPPGLVAREQQRTLRPGIFTGQPGKLGGEILIAEIDRQRRGIALE